MNDHATRTSQLLFLARVIRWELEHLQKKDARPCVRPMTIDVVGRFDQDADLAEGERRLGNYSKVGAGGTAIHHGHALCQ